MGSTHGTSVFLFINVFVPMAVTLTLWLRYEGDTPTDMIAVCPFHKGLLYRPTTTADGENGCTFKKKAHLKFLHRMSPEMSTVMMILEDSNYNFKKSF